MVLKWAVDGTDEAFSRTPKPGVACSNPAGGTSKYGTLAVCQERDRLGASAIFLSTFVMIGQNRQTAFQQA
jgi:hypothetical protein